MRTQVQFSHVLCHFMSRMELPPVFNTKVHFYMRAHQNRLYKPTLLVTLCSHLFRYPLKRQAFRDISRSILINPFIEICKHIFSKHLKTLPARITVSISTAVSVVLDICYNSTQFTGTNFHLGLFGIRNIKDIFSEVSHFSS